ncbi:MAG: nucleoside hydrolase [Acidimicrobiales bacterium]
MRRFMIDTDTASDDAIAILMALRHPDVVVEAITVVAGNVPVSQGVQNALYAVELAAGDTPVYAGCARPLLRDLDTAQDVHGEDGMGDCGLPVSGRRAAPGRAVDVLVDTILGSPGEITLVAIGPLTNLAAAMIRAPEVADALSRCVIMGGTGMGGPGNASPLAEYNLWADPEAARVVVRSGVDLEIVGWDVSIASAAVTPQRAAQIRAVDSPLSEFTMKVQSRVAELVADHPILDGPDLPDPITMAYAIDPSVATTAMVAVDVVTCGGPARGALEIDRLGFERRRPNAIVVTHYPADHFFAMLTDLLARL